MLGHSHALSGAVTGAATGEYILHLPLPAVGVLAALTAGFATFPDLDSVGSCAARSLGPLSRAVAWVVRGVSGGHRHGTHTVIGVAVFTALAYLATLYQHTTAGRWALAGFLSLAVSAAVGALRIHGHFADLAGVAAGAALGWTGYDLGLVVVACGLGCATHLAGDMLTDSGVPLLLPVSGYRFRWWPEPFAFSTGTCPERFLVTPVLVAGLGFLTWHAVILSGLRFGG